MDRIDSNISNQNSRFSMAVVFFYKYMESFIVLVKLIRVVKYVFNTFKARKGLKILDDFKTVNFGKREMKILHNSFTVIERINIERETR